jgi:hypothetical protein
MELRRSTQEYGIVAVAILLLCTQQSIGAHGREIWEFAR